MDKKVEVNEIKRLFKYPNYFVMDPGHCNYVDISCSKNNLKQTLIDYCQSKGYPVEQLGDYRSTDVVRVWSTQAEMAYYHTQKGLGLFQ